MPSQRVFALGIASGGAALDQRRRDGEIVLVVGSSTGVPHEFCPAVYSARLWISGYGEIRPGVVSFGQSSLIDSSRTEDHTQIVESVETVHVPHQLGFSASGRHT